MEELLGDLFEAGGIALVAVGLAAITFVFQLARLAREKGDSEPLVSAIGYVIVGGIGAAITAAICTVIFPIIGTIGGFIVGFALTLKLIYGKNISFWGLILYPITFVIYVIAYFGSMAWVLGALDEGNFIMLIIGGVIFLCALYFGIFIYFSEGEVYEAQSRALRSKRELEKALSKESPEVRREYKRLMEKKRRKRKKKKRK